VRTWTKRARRTTNVRNRPTNYFNSYIKLSLAQPTPTYDLRQQCPGTRRPSGLVKLLHNDNVVLTQECCCRHKQRQQHLRRFLTLMKTWTVYWTQVKDVRGPSPRSRVLLCQKRRAPQHDRNGGVRRRTSVATARRKR
jgi:hypothetical protein